MTDEPQADEPRLTLDEPELDAAADDEDGGPTPETLEARRLLLLARLAVLAERQVRAVRWPRWVYHASDGARVVASREAKAALGAGWQNQPIQPEA